MIHAVDGERSDAEDEVIARIAAEVGPLPDGTVGIGDDAAVVPSQGSGSPIFTVDTMVEGRHFDARLDPSDVGWKLVAVNVSDIAAMGGRAHFALLSLSLPAPLERIWLDRFALGLGEALRHFGVRLVGGDTTACPVRVASLTVGGTAARPVGRGGARPGDVLWVTGTLGRAAEAMLSPTPTADALGWLRRPRPPVGMGAALGEEGLATAMMDLSDGLHRDLRRLCARSGCGAIVDPGALPGPGPLGWRVAYGEDYELLFTAPPVYSDRVQSLAMRQRIPVTAIGLMTSGGGVLLSDMARWPAPLDAHFPERATTPTGAAR